MKLIIDISKEAKKHIDTFKGKFLCGDGFDLIEAIQNGTPLDDVLEKIRTEIKFEVDHRTNMLCAEDVLEILDNIGSEVKPNETDN